MNETSVASPAVTGRFKAETMPLVTVPVRPNGEPIAIVASPTTTSSESPSAATGKFRDQFEELLSHTMRQFQRSLRFLGFGLEK